MAKKRKLDRSRPFGTVCGDARAKFEQFGILFDAAGEELPGFEKVEIPRDVPSTCSDTEGLKAQVRELTEVNTRLQGETGKLRDDLAKAGEEKADADARAEEIQGQLDTANVEIGRLNTLIDELNSSADKGGADGAVQAAEPKKPAGKGKQGDKGDGQVDDQLALQTGGSK